MNRQEIEGNIRVVEAEIRDVESLLKYASPSVPESEIERWRNRRDNLEIRRKDLNDSLRYY